MRTRLISTATLFAFMSLACTGGGAGGNGSGNGGSGLGVAPECTEHLDCEWNEICHADECEEIFGRSFGIVIESAETETDAGLDSLGGAPDLFVVVEANGDRCRTSVVDDDFFPEWDEVCDMVLSSGGDLIIELYDEDVSTDELVLVFEAQGNDEIAELVQTEYLVFSNSISTVNIQIRPDF
ncbi:MAG: C2 domain-containing protein [Myxococcota bacterium]|nr:C2 domain-containing protein [Myxococcota bacterium]